MNEQVQARRADLQPHERGSERVVLLDESAQPIGSAEKMTVHNDSTPLHLAFSCYLLNNLGEVLTTRRALSKQTWPGVWSNSFCGHPAPDELPEDALARRADQELGAKLHDIRLVLPDFRYRAIDASGVVENEVCPVYIARIASQLHPNPNEVTEWAWVSPTSLIESVGLTPFAFSPWMQLQIPQLREALKAVSGRTGVILREADTQ